MLSQEQKHQPLVHFWSCVPIQKVVASLDMSQSFVEHLKKDVGSEIERPRGGHSKLLTNQEKRHCITHFIKGQLVCINVMCALREVGSDQVCFKV